MTVEAYIRPTSLSGQQEILDFRQSGGGYDVRLTGSQAQYTIQLDGNSGIAITTPLRRSQRQSRRGWSSCDWRSAFFYSCCASNVEFCPRASDAHI
jgi:hypothetical protein